jgi:Family of unknown function (DUF6065)
LVKRLIAYRINPQAQRIVPGGARRQWMDETRFRYAYRCLPLTIANSMGWELLLPAGVTAEWNGGSELSDIEIQAHDPEWTRRVAISHFGHGVLTFPIHYLFRTEPGIALWARGVPNRPKDGIAPLDGIIETDWLEFTFTMNWQFTRPGRVVFEKDEPICFITPIDYCALKDVVPEIVELSAAPEVAENYHAYRKSRENFNARLSDNEPTATQEGWQKSYMRGESPVSGARNPLHMSKLNLAEPVEVRGDESSAPQALGADEGSK